MITSREINDKLQKAVLNGSKTPHSTSYPVIRNESGKYYLACFVFFFTKEDIAVGKVNRPEVWAIADIETGEIIEERQARDNDFSDASYDIKYDIHGNSQYDTSRQYYEKAFAILDCVREKIISTGIFCKNEYRNYLDMILANIPDEYKRFYANLSA